MSTNKLAYIYKILKKFYSKIYLKKLKHFVKN